MGNQKKQQSCLWVSMIGPLWLAALGLATAAILGQFGSTRWYFDAMSHFKMQYLIATSILMGVTLIFRAKRLTILYLALFCVYGAFLLPYYTPISSASEPGSPPLRLMMANVLYGNQSVGLLTKSVIQADPDILVLIEMNPANKARFESLKDHFEFHYSNPASETVIYSNIHISISDPNHITESSRPQTWGRFFVNGQEVTLIAAHTSVPLGELGFNKRNQELAQTAQIIAEIDSPVIFTGDLNISSFSPIFKEFLSDASLKDGRLGFGTTPTWPNFYPRMMIPIDHFAASEEISVTNFQTGAPTGSDHMAIVVDFELNDSLQ